MHSMTAEPIYRPDVKRGKVQWFNDAKGFGFIRPGTMCSCPCHEGFNGLTFERCVHCEPSHTGDVFVHFSAIQVNGYKSLAKKEIVEFEVRPSSRPGYEWEAASVWKVRG